MTDVLESAPLVAPQRLSNDSLDTLFSRAATANSFAPEPVTDEELRSIWDLAKWPPTSANFQPMRVLFVQSPEGRATLGEHMSEGNRAKTLAAPAVAVLAFDRSWHENIATTTPHLAHLTEFFAANDDPRLDAEAIDAHFFPDGDWGTFLVINIGHPTEGSYRARMPRLDQEQTVQFA